MRLPAREWKLEIRTDAKTRVTLPECFDQEVDIRAAGAICPMPCCGALVIAYRPADSLRDVTTHPWVTWEFVCSDCGSEFSIPQTKLLFQSVPRDWLLAEVCHA